VSAAKKTLDDGSRINVTSPPLASSERGEHGRQEMLLSSMLVPRSTPACRPSTTSFRAWPGIRFLSRYGSRIKVTSRARWSPGWRMFGSSGQGLARHFRLPRNPSRAE